MPNNPKISVLMSVYNGERYLREAVDSILNQTLSDFEFIIINDGSADGTRDILESYGDHRIRLFHQENIGLTRSLNKGISLARGEYIARMDADDVSLPERLESQMRIFDERPDLFLVGTATRVIGDAGERVWVPDFSHSTLPALLLVGNQFAHASALFRRGEVTAAGGYDEAFPCAEDYELSLRVAWQGYRFSCVKRPLYIVRKHKGSVSVVNERAQADSKFRAQLRMIRWIRRNCRAVQWVDPKALREALLEVSWLWRNGQRASAAREAALTMVALWPFDVTGYRLFAGALPTAPTLKSLFRRAARTLNYEPSRQD